MPREDTDGLRKRMVARLGRAKKLWRRMVRRAIIIILLSQMFVTPVFANVTDKPTLAPEPKGDEVDAVVIVVTPGGSGLSREVEFVCSAVTQPIFNVAMVAEESYAAMYSDLLAMRPIEAELVTREASYAIILDFLRERGMQESVEGRAYNDLVVTTLNQLQADYMGLMAIMLPMHQFWEKYKGDSRDATADESVACWEIIMTPDASAALLVSMREDKMPKIRAASDAFVEVFRRHSLELEAYKRRRFEAEKKAP
jgi:hypothetical protein